MAQFPYKSYTTNPGKKRNIVIYSLAGVLLVVVCLTAYSCTKKSGAEPTSDGTTPATMGTATTPGAATTAPLAPSAGAAPTAPVAAAAPTTIGTGAVATAATVASIPAGPDVKTATQATALIAQANADIAQNKIIKARDALNQALTMPLSAADQAAVKASLGKLADSWLFGPTVLEGDTMCSNYAVKSGDKFITIAKAHKTDYPVIMVINKIDKAGSLRVGQNLKVINGPFRCVVSRSTYTLDLYVQNTFVRSFKVGLGKPGRETPAGTWEVTNDKSIKPKWTDPDTKKTYYGTDPDYPLGTRWIGLKGVSGSAVGRTGFALHGTNKPEELGTNISRGCIRLANPDIELLYSMLAPISTQVVVVD